MNYNVRGTEAEVILSFDDGCAEDMRIADLLRKYDLSGIFYIPSANRKLTDDQVRLIAKDFTIGGHTKNHRFLRTIPLPDAEAEIVEGKEELEALIGRKITSFCYPRGRFNESVKEMVAGAGFTEARTTRVFATRRGSDPYELDTTIHMYDRSEYEGKHWLGLAIYYFDRLLDPDSDNSYFHLWGHGWEITKYDYWRDFEFLLSYMSERLHQQHD